MQKQQDEYKRAIVRLVTTIPQNKRIISNHQTKIKPHNVTQNNATLKPNGLWYSVGSSWLEWCIANECKLNSIYIHELTINEDLIIKVTNEAEFDALVAKYGIDDEKYEAAIGLSLNYFRRPNWQALTNKYAGIEIAPYLWSKRLNELWYYGWDCASGCIWDKAAIYNVQLYAQYYPKVRGFRRIKHEQSQDIRTQCHQTICLEGG